MWFWALLSNLLSFVLIYFMVLTNTDTKSLLFKDIVPRISGWLHRIRQRIKRLLPAFFVLTGHPP